MSYAVVEILAGRCGRKILARVKKEWPTCKAFVINVYPQTLDDVFARQAIVLPPMNEATLVHAASWLLCFFVPNPAFKRRGQIQYLSLIHI